VDQRVAEPEVSVLREPGTVEDFLRTLWERVRMAGETIRDLRSDKHNLTARIGEIENELSKLQAEMQQKDQELKRLRTERAHLLSADGNAGFTEEEKETLRARIHEIISKINSHL
jgi:chromosome segregation ATPase